MRRGRAGKSGAGSVLILALWSMGVLSLTVLPLSFEAAAQAKLARREQEAFRARMLFRTGLELALLSLDRDPEPHADGIRDPWRGVLKLPDEWGKGLSVFLEDEEAKLDLNQTGERLLEGLLETLRKDDGIQWAGDEKEMAEMVMRWKAKKPQHKLEFLEELLLIEGMAPHDFEALRPYVTVAAGPAARPVINVNTALAPVLKAVIFSLPGDEWAKRKWLHGLLEDRREQWEGKRAPWAPGELAPVSLLERLKLPPSAGNLAFANLLAPHLTADSRTFRVKIAARAESRRAEALVRVPGDGRAPQMLGWHED